MTNSKIKHPYQVPEDFFNNLENEIMTKVDAEINQDRKRHFILQVLKYAAIVLFAIFLGRESVKLIPGNRDSTSDQESISVDLVLSQISDEDITEFLIENNILEISAEN